MKTSNGKSENKFYNINHVVNANTIEMVDKSKTWVMWSADQMKKGLTIRRLNRIAHTLSL
ncbi:hypothetical protein EP331_00340 [bacterium]|nr:MAG: hypothetical protein EP331_00340 [bacterium]